MIGPEVRLKDNSGLEKIVEILEKGRDLSVVVRYFRHVCIFTLDFCQASGTEFCFSHKSQNGQKKMKMKKKLYAL